jgi:tRNA nucleotidyltransferase/poly(A) polymerase
MSDLQNNLLRAVGDPVARFTEDPLRVLRMVRFGDAQGRVIEPTTLAAATSVAPKLAQVSVERVRTELDRIVLSPFPDDGVRRLLSLGALPYTLPELLPAVGFEQNRFHIHDVFEHTMWVLKRAPADRILRWAAIFHDVGKPHTLSVDEGGNRHFYLHELHSEQQSKVRLEALKFSHKDAQAITTIVRHHMRPLDCGAAGVRRLIRDLGPELAHWRQFKEADAPPTVPEEEFRKSAARFDALLATELQRAAGPSYGKLAVSGDDLKALGLQAGKELGKLLKELEELVIEDPTLNTRSNLLAEARKRYPLNSGK